MSVCTCKPVCKCLRCRCGSYFARIFEALGHPTRLKIIALLQQRPHNVSEIIKETGIEQTCVSHCLRTLESNGFVTARQEGRFRVYALNKKELAPLADFLEYHLKDYPQQVPRMKRHIKG